MGYPGTQNLASWLQPQASHLVQEKPVSTREKT
jgi:hypothetical protein